MLTTHSVAFFLFGNVPSDYFFIYIADCFYIVSSCPEMPAIPVSKLWMAVKQHQCALPLQAGYSAGYTGLGWYGHIHMYMILAYRAFDQLFPLSGTGVSIYLRYPSVPRHTLPSADTSAQIPNGICNYTSYVINYYRSFVNTFAFF